MHFGADFDALIARLSPHKDRPIALAVSGGSDSLALLSLADAWAKKRRRALLVMTVDHQLRPEARAEASAVARLALDLGYEHRTLVWDKPRASQNAARVARYQLLCGAAREQGASCILLGHTFDDVVETALIRRRRGVRDVSIAGPSMVSPAPIWPDGRGVSIIRPLVGESRDVLQDHLRQRQWPWTDDPSNHSFTYERVRVRKFLDRHPSLKRQSAQFVRSLQMQRQTKDVAVGQCLAQAQVHADGLVQIDASHASPRVMALLCRCASGSASAPRAKALSELMKRLHAPGARQTLGGAWFQKTASGFLVGRDPGSTSDSSVGEVYDGRFVRAADSSLPVSAEQGFLVRHASPPCEKWREIVSERLAHIALCYRTPNLNPVDRTWPL